MSTFQIELTGAADVVLEADRVVSSSGQIQFERMFAGKWFVERAFAGRGVARIRQRSVARNGSVHWDVVA